MYMCICVRFSIWLFMQLVQLYNCGSVFSFPCNKSLNLWMYITVPAFLICKSINLWFFELAEAGQGSPADLHIYDFIVFLIVPPFCIYESINLWIVGTICGGRLIYLHSKYISVVPKCWVKVSQTGVCPYIYLYIYIYTYMKMWSIYNIFLHNYIYIYIWAMLYIH